MHRPATDPIRPVFHLNYNSGIYNWERLAKNDCPSLDTSVCLLILYELALHESFLSWFREESKIFSLSKMKGVRNPQPLSLNKI